MAKLARVTNVIFASSAPSNTMEQFGSFVATGIPNYTNDPAIIQALSAWVDGWTVAINAGNKAPYVQDMNAAMFVFSRQLSYIFQEGIPEWDAGTTYYKGSYVQSTAGDGQRFISLQDANLGNMPPSSSSNAFWQWDNPPVAVVVVGNALKANLNVAPYSGAPFTQIQISFDLLSVQGVTIGPTFSVVNIAASGAGGLDTGSPTNNTWYAVYVITNNLGTTVWSLFSLSGTSPTLPPGYTKFRRVGWAYRGAGNFRQFLNIGNWWHWTDASAVQIGGIGGGSGATGTLTWTAGAPPTCQQAMFDLGVITTAQNSGMFAVRVTGTSMAYRIVWTSPSPDVPQTNSPIVAMSAGQQFDYQIQNVAMSGMVITLAAYYDAV